MPWLMVCLALRTATGGWAAICWARLERLVEQVVVRDELLHEADPVGRLRVDASRRVVASRRAHAGPICAGALRTPKPGIRPIVASLKANLAFSEAMRHVAGERQLGAAAVGDAVDGGDHDRLRALDRVEAVEHDPQVAAVGVHVREVVEGVDVAAGAERPTRSGQHARADVGVGVERVAACAAAARRTRRSSRSACRRGRSSRSPCRPRVAGRRTRCDTTNCLVETLTALLRSHVHPSAECAALRRASVGNSQETWFFDAVWPGGSRALVLRRSAADGTLTWTDRAVEYDALRLVGAAGLPVPPVVWLDASGRRSGAAVLRHGPRAGRATAGRRRRLVRAGRAARAPARGARGGGAARAAALPGRGRRPGRARALVRALSRGAARRRCRCSARSSAGSRRTCPTRSPRCCCGATPARTTCSSPTAASPPCSTGSSPTAATRWTTSARHSGPASACWTRTRSSPATSRWPARSTATHCAGSAAWRA